MPGPSPRKIYRIPADSSRPDTRPPPSRPCRLSLLFAPAFKLCEALPITLTSGERRGVMVSFLPKGGHLCGVRSEKAHGWELVISYPDGLEHREAIRDGESLIARQRQI